MVDLGVES